MKHYFDPTDYEYRPEPHKFLIRKWHQDLNLPFPPVGDTFYDDETREIHQGSYVAIVKTPPPWVGKIMHFGGFVGPTTAILERGEEVSHVVDVRGTGNDHSDE